MKRPENDGMVTSDDILGRDALDPEGELLGTVVKLHIDREKKSLTGITVDQGFFRPDLFVGIDFIRQFGIDAVFLDRIPFEKYLGLKVYSSEGRQLGIVTDVQGGGTIEALTIKVKDPDHLMKARYFEIKATRIKEIGASVILKDEQLQGQVLTGNGEEKEPEELS